MALRFRVAGFPVQVHLLFLLTVLATGATGWRSPERVAVWFGVVFLSVLIHELGHALMFRRYGHEARIALHALGGTTSSTGGRPLTHRQNLWLSLAGPVAGFLLGGLVLGLQHFTPVGQAGGLVGYAMASLLWTNFGWGLINLLPILPLDGGHALAAVIRERGGSRYEWLIHGISLGTAAVGLVLAIVWKNPWMGAFALVLAVLNLGQFARAWVERRYMRQIRAASKRVRPTLETHEASGTVERFLSQLRPSPRARQPSAPKPPVAPPEQHIPSDHQFLGEWLLDNGLAELALPPLRAAFAETRTPQTGHALATALLEASRYAELLRLLSSPDVTHLGDETLQLIATRAETSGQSALAMRVRELRQGRTSTRAPRA